MTHLFRTHRVDLDPLFDKNNLDPGLQIKYVDTHQHIADILRKDTSSLLNGGLVICSLTAISQFYFSSVQKDETMSKRHA